MMKDEKLNCTLIYPFWFYDGKSFNQINNIGKREKVT